MKKTAFIIFGLALCQSSFAELTNLTEHNGFTFASKVYNDKEGEHFLPANVVVGEQYLKKTINGKTICIKDSKSLDGVSELITPSDKKFGLPNIKVDREIVKCNPKQQYVSMFDHEPIIQHGHKIYSNKRFTVNSQNRTFVQDMRVIFSGVNIYNDDGKCVKERVTYNILESTDYEEIGEKDSFKEDIPCLKK